MFGTILFRTHDQLAEFLAAFCKTGCTATFTVTEDSRGYTLEFNGGK